MKETLMQAVARYQAHTKIFWVIYQRPKDIPHQEFVVRGHIVKQDASIAQTTDAFFFQTLADARRPLQYAGLRRQDRHPQDDVAIVETWL